MRLILQGVALLALACGLPTTTAAPSTAPPPTTALPATTAPTNSGFSLDTVTVLPSAVPDAFQLLLCGPGTATVQAPVLVTRTGNGEKDYNPGKKLPSALFKDQSCFEFEGINPSSWTDKNTDIWLHDGTDEETPITDIKTFGPYYEVTSAKTTSACLGESSKLVTFNTKASSGQLVALQSFVDLCFAKTSDGSQTCTLRQEDKRVQIIQRSDQPTKSLVCIKDTEESNKIHYCQEAVDSDMDAEAEGAEFEIASIEYNAPTLKLSKEEELVYLYALDPEDSTAAPRVTCSATEGATETLTCGKAFVKSKALYSACYQGEDKRIHYATIQDLDVSLHSIEAGKYFTFSFDNENKMAPYRAATGKAMPADGKTVTTVDCTEVGDRCYGFLDRGTEQSVIIQYGDESNSIVVGLE